MKNLYSFVILIFLFALFANQATAQDKANKKSTDKKYFKVAIDYQSDNIYSGRRDSISTGYITPLLGYYTKSGFYINGSLSILMNEGRVDVFSLEGGYDFKIGKLDGGISVQRYFYNAQSYNVQSEISGNASANIGYQFKYLKPSLEAEFNIGATPDYALTVGFEHTFYAIDDELEITPSIFINGSTMNFYDSYFQKRRYAKTRKGSGETTGTVLNGAQFMTRDFEFSVPLDYTINKFSLNFTPGYVIPVNPNIVVIDTKSSTGSTSNTYTEKLENTFFWSIGASYKF